MGSNMVLTGSGGNLTLDASSSSDADLSQFPVVNASMDVSGASSVTVNASGILNVDASSASIVYYLGNPSLGEIDTSSAASVEPK